MNDKKDLIKIRKKAKKDVIKNKCVYPKCNNIQNQFNLQTCPKCNALQYKNKTNENNEPKTMETLKEYETECVACDNVTAFCFCCYI